MFHVSYLHVQETFLQNEAHTGKAHNPIKKRPVILIKTTKRLDSNDEAFFSI